MSNLYLFLFSLAVAVIMFLLPKNLPVVIGCLIAIFCLLFLPIWNFYWIKQSLWLRFSALLFIGSLLCLLGYYSLLGSVAPVKIAKPLTPEISTTQTKPTTQKEMKISSLDPYEIINKINSSPPYQQAEVSKNYVGLWVEWKGKFNHIEDMGNDLIKISLQAISKEPQKGYQRSIWIDFITQISPELKTMNKGKEITIKGRIAGFDLVDTIILDNVSF